MLNVWGFLKGEIPIIDKNKVIDVMAESIVNTAKALSKSYEEAKPKVGIVMQIPSISGDPYIVAVNKQNYSAYPLSTETYSIRQTVLVFIVKNGSKNFIIGGTSDHTLASYTSLSDIPSAFTPTSHTHGNITNDGKIGDTSGKFLITGSQGFVSTMSSSELINYIYLAIHRIGDIVFTTDSTNPGTIYGGTWAAWGSGRVPVGYDSAQTEFNTVEKTGGNKNMQAHTHNFRYKFINTASGSGATFRTPAGTSDATAAGTDMVISTGDGNTQNLQPYITCYMWKRTA